MTHFVTVETGTLLHVFLLFAIDHALTGKAGLGLSSVNVHQDVFVMGLLGCGIGSGHHRFRAAIILCCASFLLSEYISAFMPRLVKGGRLFSPFGKCRQLVHQLHPKNLGDKRAVHVAYDYSAKDSVVLYFLESGFDSEGVET
jgi:hypothetical protein